MVSVYPVQGTELFLVLDLMWHLLVADTFLYDIVGGDGLDLADKSLEYQDIIRGMGFTPDIVTEIRPSSVDSLIKNMTTEQLHITIAIFGQVNTEGFDTGPSHYESCHIVTSVRL